MDFSSAYRSIVSEDSDESFKNMKALALLLQSEEVKSLDHDSYLFLLEEKLKGCDIISKQPPTEGTVNLKSNIKSLDLGSLLKEPCMKDGICCTQTEQALESDFEEFSKHFQKNFNAKNASAATTQGVANKKNSLIPSKLNRVVDYGETSKKVQESKNVGFVTAREELNAQNFKKYGSSSSNIGNTSSAPKRKLGLRSTSRKFVSPLLANNTEGANKSEEDWPVTNSDENLKNIDPRMIEMIQNEIMDTGAKPIGWDDIAGLQFAKSAIQEAVVWPMLRPDIFTGLRRPPKGILLFGPPGTGKTLIGKCVACQSKSTFFSISASSLTSKWIGDGEKMVRALFAVARTHQPAVIFIDEIDSLLSQRSDSEHESSRRIKTEFLVQLDGATTDNEEKLLLVGATNRPQELDEAARRRFVKRLYIPLPEYEGRLELLKKLISGEKHQITQEHFEEIARLSDGYSGADIRSLCAEASLGPIRSINVQLMAKIQPEDVRPLMMEDFQKALLRVKSSVSPKDLEQYVQWNDTFGSGL